MRYLTTIEVNMYNIVYTYIENVKYILRHLYISLLQNILDWKYI